MLIPLEPQQQQHRQQFRRLHRPLSTQQLCHPSKVKALFLTANRPAVTQASHLSSHEARESPKASKAHAVRHHLMAVGNLLKVAVGHQEDHQEEADHKEDFQIILQENREIPPDHPANHETTVVTVMVAVVVAEAVTMKMEEAAMTATTAAMPHMVLLDLRPQVRR